MRIKTIMLACWVMLTLGIKSSQAQDGLTGNFVVVVGAFASHSNADHFVAEAKRQRLRPVVELNKFRNLYYVCVLETKDHDQAIAEAIRLRAETKFKDSWVYNGTMQDLGSSGQSEDVHPETRQVIIPVAEKPVEEVAVIEVVTVEKKSAADSLRERKEAIKAEVDKESMTMKKGEMARLNHIYFYKDAAVLRPESQYEVDRLVTILKKNPTMKIRIHGHTNGNDSGKIIKMNDYESDFFALDGTVEDQGSAKELSELRANTIKEYLSRNGISKNRMSIKAWGGKKPLFDIDDDRATANVRVEIEVVQNE